MTKDDLHRFIRLQQEFEFSVDGISYNLTYDRDCDNNPLIVFGKTFQGEVYDSFGDLINRAKIGNHFLKDMLDTIPLN